MDAKRRFCPTCCIRLHGPLERDFECLTCGMVIAVRRDRLENVWLFSEEYAAIYDGTAVPIMSRPEKDGDLAGGRSRPAA